MSMSSPEDSYPNYPNGWVVHQAETNSHVIIGGQKYPIPNLLSDEEFEAQLVKERNDALSRLPDFPEEHRAERVLDALKFTLGSYAKAPNYFARETHRNIMEDLRDGYPEIVTHEVYTGLVDQFLKPSTPEA